MANRVVVKRQLVVLREALADLGRYRLLAGREDTHEGRDVQLLVEYAVLRALNSSLDIVRQWAQRRTEAEGPRCVAGLDEMQEAGAVDGEIAAHLRRWSKLRRLLANQWRHDPADVFEVFSTESLTAFADGVDAYLTTSIERLREGAVVTGVVARVADFGAFVDLGGVRALLHVSEMSRNMVRHPSDVVVKGQAVSVVVLAIDPATERIQLRLEPLREHAPPVLALDCALAA